MRHGEAIEVDLLPRGIDLLDFYRPDGALSARRLWALIRGLLLIDVSDDEIQARPGTALAQSLHGAFGDWSRLDHIVGGVLGVKPPEDKAQVEWKRAQQERIKRMRAERAAATSSS